MNNKFLMDKINAFFSTDLEKTVNNILIIQDETGNYELFNKYIVSYVNDSITVQIKHTYTVKQFSSLPVAVTWCIFDNRNKIMQSNRIEYLDQLLTGLDSSILLHKKIFKNNKDMRFISLAKLSEDLYKKKILRKELLNYVSDSKVWQLKQFSQK